MERAGGPSDLDAQPESCERRDSHPCCLPAKALKHRHHIVVKVARAARSLRRMNALVGALNTKGRVPTSRKTLADSESWLST